MPRTPRKKETKNPVIIEEVKEPDTEPVAEHRNCLMHEKQSFSSHQPEDATETEQAPKNDAYYYNKDKTPEPEDEQIELEIPKKRPKQRTEKQLEQLRIAREKSLANKELRRKQKEEAEEAVKKELESKIQAEKKAIEEKIVKKALSIKKKEIKKQEILDEISDDDTPIEKVKIPVKKEPSLKVKTSKTLYFD